MRIRIVVLACVALVCLVSPAAAQKAGDTPEQHLAGGWKAYEAKDYKAAKREFERATKLKKDFADAYLGLALVARLQGKHGEALKQTGRALAARPDFAEAHYVLGRLHYDENDVEHARAEARKALDLNPKLYAAHALMGDVEIAAGNYEAALASFDAARAIAAAEFDAVPRLRDRYEAVKAYLAAKARGDEKAEGYAKPHILNRPRPAYTERARDLRVSGSVKLLIRFSTEGRVDRVVVVTGLPEGLTESAIRAVSELVAEPATLGGKPIEAWATVLVNFEIR
jgi:TonB family protein